MTTILLGLAGGYLTLLGAGFGLVLLLARGTPRINLIEGCCLAWIFGVGVVSLLLWAVGTFVSGIALPLFVFAGCFAIAFAGWKCARRSRTTFFVSRPRTVLQWMLLSLLAFQTAMIFWASMKHGLGWDGLLDWEIKARYAFLGDNVVPSHYYNSGRIFSHPEYPLAIPFAELWLYVWMGEAHQFWIKTIFPVFYAVGAALLALLSARLTGKHWAGYGVAVLFFFVPQVTVGVGGAIFGYVDFPISVVYLATIGYLLCWIKSDSSYHFRIYSACLAMLPWMKREGAILWLIAATAGIAVILIQRQPRAKLLALAPGLLIMIGWEFYLRALHSPPSQEFLPLSLITFWTNAGRLLRISRGLFLDITYSESWSVFWLLAVVAIIYLFLRIRNLQNGVLLCAIIFPIMAYSSVYVFSAWPDYLRHAGSSLPRLLMHVIPILWIAIASAASSPLQTRTSSTRNVSTES